MARNLHPRCSSWVQFLGKTQHLLESGVGWGVWRVPGRQGLCGAQGRDTDVGVEDTGGARRAGSGKGWVFLELL